MKTSKPRYRYRQDRDGVDDQWTVVDTQTDREIAYSIYWDSHPDWQARTEADIRLIVDALNAYVPAAERRA
jgi:hypothetical protein